MSEKWEHKLKGSLIQGRGGRGLTYNLKPKFYLQNYFKRQQNRERSYERGARFCYPSIGMRRFAIRRFSGRPGLG